MTSKLHANHASGELPLHATTFEQKSGQPAG
jgi:hypothetical protein